MRDIAGRNAKTAAEMAETSKRDGVDLRAIELDVQSEPSIDVAVKKIMAESGKIDVLVHNAGHMMFGPAEAFLPEQFAVQYDVTGVPNPGPVFMLSICEQTLAKTIRAITAPMIPEMIFHLA